MKYETLTNEQMAQIEGKTEYTCTVCHRKFHYVPHTV